MEELTYLDKEKIQVNTIFYFWGKILFFLLFTFLIFQWIFGIETIHRMIPPCYFHSITGMYCPGCGGPRAVVSLFQFRIFDSLKYHAFVLYSLILYIIFMSNFFYHKHITKHIEKVFSLVHYIYISIGIIILQWILKNIFLFIFHYDWMK